MAELSESSFEGERIQVAGDGVAVGENTLARFDVQSCGVSPQLQVALHNVCTAIAGPSTDLVELLLVALRSPPATDAKPIRVLASLFRMSCRTVRRVQSRMQAGFLPRVSRRAEGRPPASSQVRVPMRLETNEATMLRLVRLALGIGSS